MREVTKTIYQQIDELQIWIRENQARGNDDLFMSKVAHMKKLMSEAYAYTEIKI
jgi:hypothetical protein